MLPSGRSALFSDTVGFLTDLPPQLIAAFKSTLEEVNHADLLLHVVDASSPYRAEQRRTVLDILRDIGVPEQRLRSRLIEVHNKADSLPPEASAEGAEEEEDEEEEEGGKPARFRASALTGEGLEAVVREVDRMLSVKAATRDLSEALDRFGSGLLDRTSALKKAE